MTSRAQASGVAALAVCESLFLALNDLKIIPEAELMNMITDAISTLEASSSVTDAGWNSADAEVNLAAAMILRNILSSGNSVRRPA